MADGKLIFDTKLDTKGLQTGLKGIDSKLSSIGKTATIGFGAIATGLTTAGIQGVKFNAQVEQYTATFETFTGSVEGANKTIERLQKLGASTPFEFTDLAETTQLLMAYGLSADEAVDSLTMLGDASQGNAEKLTSIATGFARMKSSGKVTLEYLNLMIENGFNPLNQVAENTGMTMAEVYDAISKGQLPLEEVTKAMEQMTSEGGQYFGLMEKQSQTMNGMMSTLSDTIQMKLGEAFGVVNEKIVEILPNLISFIENLDVEKVLDGLTTLISVLGGILVVVNLIKGAIAVFNMITWLQQIGGMAVLISNVTANISLFATTLAPIVGVILSVIAVVVAFTMAIKQLWDTNEAFRNKVTLMWESIQETIKKIYEQVIQPIYEKIKEVLKDLWEGGIKPLWDDFVDFVGGVIIAMTNLWDALQPIIDWIIDVFGERIVNVINDLLEAFLIVFNTISEILGNWFESVGQIIDGVVGIFTGIMDFIEGVFTGDWQQAWDGLAEILTGAFDSVVGAVKVPLNGIIGLVNGAIEGLNKISVTIPDWVPFVGGNRYSVDLPKIPYLQRGGILRKGQQGFLEGNGAEAVVPLERNKHWLRALGKEMINLGIIGQQRANEQTIIFNQPVQSADEVSRKLRIDARMGLIG